MQGNQGRGAAQYWSPDERICERCGARVSASDVKCSDCGVPFVELTRRESRPHQLFVALLVTWTVILPLGLVVDLWRGFGGFGLLVAGAINMEAFIPWATGVLMLGVLCYVTDKR